VTRIRANSQPFIGEISVQRDTLADMPKMMDERAGRISHTELEVPTVTAEVVDGVVTALDLAHVFDRLHELGRRSGERVRRARARLFGPGPGTLSFAEATLILSDGSTVSESGDGTTTRRAVDLLASRLDHQLRVR
jgi:hypothetical protein